MSSPHTHGAYALIKLYIYGTHVGINSQNVVLNLCFYRVLLNLVDFLQIGQYP